MRLPLVLSSISFEGEKSIVNMTTFGDTRRNLTWRHSSFNVSNVFSRPALIRKSRTMSSAASLDMGGRGVAIGSIGAGFQIYM